VPYTEHGYMIGLLIWVLFGLAAAVAATNKGLGGRWLVLAVLLGPFGLLVLVVSKDEKALEERALSAGERRKCPFCAELIKPEARKCRFCGSELETVVENPEAVDVPLPPGDPVRVQCRRCDNAEIMERSALMNPASYRNFQTKMRFWSWEVVCKRCGYVGREDLYKLHRDGTV